MKTLVFDTETTALISNSLLKDQYQPHVIEFYGCLIDGKGKKIDELDSLIDPGKPIPEEVTRITGIKQGDIDGCPKFSELAESIIALIESSDTVVAHNLSYDMSVIDFELKRLGKKVHWPKSLICTVEQTEHIFGFRLNLSALHEHLFGEPFSGAHRAKVDVEALTRCYLKLKNAGEI